MSKLNLILNRNCDSPKCKKDNKGQAQTGSDLKAVHCMLF